MWFNSHGTCHIVHCTLCLNYCLNLMTTCYLINQSCTAPVRMLFMLMPALHGNLHMKNNRKKNKHKEICRGCLDALISFLFHWHDDAVILSPVVVTYHSQTVVVRCLCFHLHGAQDSVDVELDAVRVRVKGDTHRVPGAVGNAQVGLDDGLPRLFSPRVLVGFDCIEDKPHLSLSTAEVEAIISLNTVQTYRGNQNLNFFWHKKSWTLVSFCSFSLSLFGQGVRARLSELLKQKLHAFCRNWFLVNGGNRVQELFHQVEVQSLKPPFVKMSCIETGELGWEKLKKIKRCWNLLEKLHFLAFL